MSPSDRWPAILLQLEPDTWTRAADLARALGVSERTVYRDVHALVEAGVPLQGVPGKGYRVPDDYLLAPVQLTTDEAIMLVLGSAYAAQNVGGRYRASARAAQERIEALLPPDDRERARSLQGNVQLVPHNVFGNSTEEGLLRQVRHALVEERTLLVKTSGADGETDRMIDPYGLVRQGTTWYIVGFGHDRGRVIHLRLPTLDTLDVTEETFERPASYGSSPDAPSTEARRQVRVVFAADVASSVHVAPPRTVSNRELLSDGRLLLTLKVEDELAVMPWLLSWGSHVHVLEPSSLRERVAAEAQSVADQYEAGLTLLD